MRRRLSAGFWIGFVMLCVGALLLLTETGLIDLRWGVVWPLFILGLGLCFHIGFALGGARAPGVLVPGGILITYGLLFFACTILGWRLIARWWPIFIIGPGIGLLELYLFSGKPRDRGLLIPVCILFALGFAMLAVEVALLDWDYFLPVALIVAGGVVLGLNLGRRGTRDRIVADRTGDGVDDDFMSAPSTTEIPVSPLETEMPLKTPVWPSEDGSDGDDGPDVLDEMRRLDEPAGDPAEGEEQS